jgi:uncharacterized protein (DUF1015 family)
MATIRPLSLDVLRPAWTSEVPSPPHDALTPAQRRDHLQRFPLSYLGVTRAPEDVDPDRDISPHDLLIAGRRSLEDLLARNVFEPASGPRYHVYRLDVDGRSQTGLVAGVAVDDYDSGMVRIHEQIKESRAQHLANHLGIVRAQSSPIALACADDDRFSAVLGEVTGRSPSLDFVTLDGLRQIVWPVDRPDEARHLTDLMANRPLYLTDGHHRAAAAASYRARRRDEQDNRNGHPDPELPGIDWMLSAVFPASEMKNRAFHRFVTIDSFADFLEQMAERLTVRPANHDEIADRSLSEVPILGWNGDGRRCWYLIDLPLVPGNLPSTVIDNLDPVRLREHVLHPVLNIDESRSNGRLTHRPGSDDPAVIEEMLEPGQMMFVMRPVSMADLFEASDRGLTMPPKSTYFEPKVRSGVFLHRKELV